MRIKDFLVGNLGFFGFVAIMLTGVLLAVGFDKAGQYLIIYISAFSALYLGIRFALYYSFYAKIKEEIKSTASLNDIAKKVKPNTWEQELFIEIIEHVVDDYNKEIYRHNEMRHDYEEFIEGWVHEIKTPVATTRLIIEKYPYDENILSIEEEVDRIEEDIEKVMFYAKQDSVYNDYQLRKTSLSDIVNKAAVKKRTMFMKKDISFETNNLKLEVLTDWKWMTFILAQIIQNSIKYTKKSDRFIKIYGLGEGADVTLVIEDNGIGIPKEDLSRIFNKGYTGILNRDSTNSSGLGLYMAKKMSRKLGHGISVESVEGEYTKVMIHFSELKEYYDLN